MSLLVGLMCACAVVAVCASWRGTSVRTGAARPPIPERDVDPPPGGDVAVVVVLELLDVATRAGASVPRALEVVGQAVGGTRGAALERAGRALVLGSSWPAAWAAVPDAERLAPVRRALSGAWQSGAAPGPSLHAAAERIRRGGAARSREAAGRLGVQLVLPLGLCLLPAFALVGLVPVLVSLGAGLLAP